MRFYNSFGRKIEDFQPLTADRVKIYSCGPTVYDYAQIGNLRAFVFDDSLRRALTANGYQVSQVMNITDVGHLVSDDDEGEDKLERGAARDQKTPQAVAEFYIEAFERDAKLLNILPPNGYNGPHQPYARATDFIPQQIDMVKLLLDKGYAYQTEQAIYFEVTKLDDYGKLSGQKLSDKEIAARAEVVTDKAKRHPQDFALWFFKTGRFANHSLSWDSPWGAGFPGWHLECSAIIHNSLGEPLDIHTGGVDHIGTHHTNEIAQTEAAFGVKLANFWLHNEHLLVDGQKMSKSKGNYYTLKDLIDKGFEPLALRLLFLQAHYRAQMNFTWESLAAAQTFLKRLQAWADLKFQPAAAAKGPTVDAYRPLVDKIKTALANDLNTAEALAAVAEQAAKDEEQGIDAVAFQPMLEALDEMLGLSLADRADIDGGAKQLLEQRQAARQAGDWAKSDELRAQLETQKIGVNDRPGGQIWHRL